MKARSSIRPVFIRRMCLFAALLSLAFALLNFLFLFVVEDAFLERVLESEASKALAIHQETGSWQQPKTPSMQIYFSVDGLPDGIGPLLRAEPDRLEFYGKEGRHYHMAHLGPDTFLLSEVSDQLLIRPLRKGILITYGVLGLLATVIASLVAYSLARRTLNPVSELADLVSTLDARKRPPAFAHRFEDNEIGLLARTLEQSITRIHAFIERETQFSKDVSHDLRTPLAVSKNALDLLARTEGYTADDTDQRQALIARLTEANRHMSVTVSALLSMARESRDEAKTPQLLLAAVETAILQNSHILDGKAVDIDIQIDANTRVTLADGVLDIILANVLGNAFHYTHQGIIHIAFKNGRLSVTDTGEGVPKHLQDSLFDKNTRADNSSGYGLGLSIVERLCTYHGVGLAVEHLATGTAVHLDFSDGG